MYGVVYSLNQGDVLCVYVLHILLNPGKVCSIPRAMWDLKLDVCGIPEIPES